MDLIFHMCEMSFKAWSKNTPKVVRKWSPNPQKSPPESDLKTEPPNMLKKYLKLLPKGSQMETLGGSGGPYQVGPAPITGLMCLTRGRNPSKKTENWSETGPWWDFGSNLANLMTYLTPFWHLSSKFYFQRNRQTEKQTDWQTDMQTTRLTDRLQTSTHKPP